MTSTNTTLADKVEGFSNFGDKVQSIVKKELDNLPEPLNSGNVLQVRKTIEEKLYLSTGCKFNMNLQVNGKWKLNTSFK